MFSWPSEWASVWALVCESVAFSICQGALFSPLGSSHRLMRTCRCSARGWRLCMYRVLSSPAALITSSPLPLVLAMSAGPCRYGVTVNSNVSTEFNTVGNETYACFGLQPQPHPVVTVPYLSHTSPIRQPYLSHGFTDDAMPSPLPYVMCSGPQCPPHPRFAFALQVSAPCTAPARQPVLQYHCVRSEQ